MSSTASVDFGNLMMTVRARLQPFVARREKIASRYHAWSRREYTRGAEMRTDPPDTVREAIETVDRDHAAAAARVYETAAPPILADLERRTTRIGELYGALVAEMEALRVVEREAAQFARACGRPSRPSLLDSAITSVGHQEWQRRVQYVLHPPPAAPRQRAADNPLVLTD